MLSPHLVWVLTNYKINDIKAKAQCITLAIHLAKNRHMINGCVDALERINDTK